MCIVSMPAMRVRALQNDFEPKHRIYDALDRPMILLDEVIEGTSTVAVQCPSRQASSLTLLMAAVLAPLLSMVIFFGTPCRFMARSEKRRAAALSRSAVSRKSMVAPAINRAVEESQNQFLSTSQTERVSHAPAHANEHDFKWMSFLHRWCFTQHPHPTNRATSPAPPPWRNAHPSNAAHPGLWWFE